MRGYQIVESSNVDWGGHGRGIPSYAVRMGFLDFLRMVKDDPDRLPRGGQFCVEGLSEVLSAFSEDESCVAAHEIKKILKQSAAHLERLLVQVQICVSGELILGESLRLTHNGRPLPIDIIFATVETRRLNDRTWYHAFFNLS